MALPDPARAERAVLLEAAALLANEENYRWHQAPMWWLAAWGDDGKRRGYSSPHAVRFAVRSACKRAAFNLALPRCVGDNAYRTVADILCAWHETNPVEHAEAIQALDVAILRVDLEVPSHGC